MSKTLIVAEKPSVARDIARVLGVKGRGEGCIVGEEYTVTWATWCHSASRARRTRAG